MAINKVSLICNYEDGSGNPVTSGMVTFTPNATVLDTGTNHVIVTQVPVVVDLSVTPLPVVSLVATDGANMSPAGWSWLVAPRFPGAPPAQLFSLPYANGPAQYLSDLLPVIDDLIEPTGGTYTGTVQLDGSPPLRIVPGAANGDVLASDGLGNAAWASLSAIGAASVSALTAETARAEAAEATFVNLTDDQSVTGVKTFTGEVVVPAPVSALDAATKAYVDAVAQGLQVKNAVQEATAAALPTYTATSTTLTASSNAALVVDGVTVLSGDRVLVKNETSTKAPNNGIFTVTATGSVSAPWVLDRAADMDSGPEVPSAFTFVQVSIPMNPITRSEGFRSPVGSEAA